MSRKILVKSGRRTLYDRYSWDCTCNQSFPHLVAQFFFLLCNTFSCMCISLTLSLAPSFSLKKIIQCNFFKNYGTLFHHEYYFMSLIVTVLFHTTVSLHNHRSFITAKKREESAFSFITRLVWLIKHFFSAIIFFFSWGEWIRERERGKE